MASHFPYNQHQPSSTPPQNSRYQAHRILSSNYSNPFLYSLVLGEVGTSCNCYLCNTYLWIVFVHLATKSTTLYLANNLYINFSLLK